MKMIKFKRFRQRLYLFYKYVIWKQNTKDQEYVLEAKKPTITNLYL